ncbi:MAG: bifunctional UDP-sugar hydrolase/5'-nucleotidase [Bacteroidia bacterium]|nr:bifunctional UDP-sugar hydrolase/5'-nucleotidase [Bacteroidia bacterium]
MFRLFQLFFLLLPYSFLQAQEITLLYTNDIESVYEPVKAFWNPDIEYIGGIPQLSSLIQQERAKATNSFLLDAGDIFTGSLSQATEGKLAFDIYSAMGYDAMAIGNHEYEYGWEKLREVIQRARFPTLNANIFYAGTDIPFAQAYTILEKNGIRLGVIGIMGVDAYEHAIMKKHVEGLEVRDPAPIVQKWVQKLKPEVDMIVVLTHQNRTAPMQTDKEADPEVQRGYDEDYALAGAVDGIDMIIGGHSDHGLWKPVQHPKTGTWIGLTFGQGKYLGYARFMLDKEKGKVKLEEGKLIPVNADIFEADPNILKLIQQARKEHPELAEAIGKVDKQAFRKYYRESNIGNLIADIFREAGNADIGIISSGSIRFDLNPGPVTIEQLLNVYPFTDHLHVVEIRGKEVIEVLEYSLTLPYGLAQLSGIELTYDSRKPKGERLLKARIGGKKIDPDRTYTVATYSFLATGGDAYKMFVGKKRKIDTRKISEILIAYFREHGTVEVPDVGRIKDVGRAE